MNDVIIATLLVGTIGLLIAILLTIASEKFSISVDEKEIQIREELPEVIIVAVVAILAVMV